MWEPPWPGWILVLHIRRTEKVFKRVSHSEKCDGSLDRTLWKHKAGIVCVCACVCLYCVCVCACACVCVCVSICLNVCLGSSRRIGVGLTQLEETLANSTENFPRLKVGVGGVERKKFISVYAYSICKDKEAGKSV